MAHLEDIIVLPGRTQAFAIRSNPFRLLTVTNRAGLLHFVEYDNAIGQLSNGGLETKLIQCDNPPSPGLIQAFLCDQGTRLTFCTPESHLTTCIYADVIDGSFFLTGGSSIVGTIAGNMLHERIEPEFEEIEA